MKLTRRLRMLELLADAHEANRKAQEAITQATRIALDDEDHPVAPKTPPNVQRDWDKTGPRSPFVLPQQFIPTLPETPAARGTPKDRPSQRTTTPDTTYAFNSESAAELLKDTLAEARTPSDRVRLRRAALRLLDQELVTEKELLSQNLVTKEDIDAHRRKK